MDLLLSKLEDESLPIVEFADATNHIIVTILHKAGEEILSIASTETKHPRSTQPGHHSSTDPAEANCQRRVQALRDELKEAPASTPQPSLDEMAAQLRRERQNLDGLRTQKRNHKFLHVTGAAQPQGQDPKTPKRSTWDYLKRYKNDHAQSSLPKEVNENTSSDPRLWKRGPLSLNPLRLGPGWRIHGSVENTKLSTNKQHSPLPDTSIASPLATPSKDIRNPHTMKPKQDG